jgi:hypothetical protein
MRIRSVTSVHLASSAAGGRHQRRVKFSSRLDTSRPSSFRSGLGTSQKVCSASRRPRSTRSSAPRPPQHRGGLEHDAQVVQMLEHLEVERADLPAGSEVHLHEASRCSRNSAWRTGVRETPRRVATSVREAVAGHQAELGDVVLHLVVDGVCERGMQW